MALNSPAAKSKAACVCGESDKIFMTNQTTIVATNLNQVLIEAIQSVKGGIGKGVDFAVEQAPEVCRQLLAWKLGEAILVMVIASIAIIVLLSIANLCRKKLKEWE